MLIEESDAEFDVSVQILQFLWSRKWQPTPVFLTGKPHGQKRLAGYSSWGCKELDPTEQLSLFKYKPPNKQMNKLEEGAY